ncbi:MAG: flippase-like domain-containing protein [Bacteroidetes bacterium]|nr:flippase-like domain-containing protein [Bacteroidota bacterium]
MQAVRTLLLWYKRYPWAVKLPVTALLGWLVYMQLAAAAWSLRSLHIDTQGWGLCLLALLLLPANLGFEAWKYSYLLKRLGVAHSASSLVMAVLSGSTAALLTPNRLGEYPARLAFVAPRDRPAALTALLADRVAQMGITLLAGLAALLFLPHFPGRVPLLCGLILGLTGLVGWALHPAFCWKLACRIPFLRNGFAPHIPRIPVLSPRLLPGLAVLAGLRYAVFGLQYALLLFAFGLPVAWGLTLALVAVVYLLKSIVPGIALAELGVRETIAIWVFGWALAPAIPVFNATLALFAINLLLPAILGLAPVLRVLWSR